MGDSGTEITDLEIVEDPETVNISNHPIHRYFLYNNESKYSSCVVKGCSTKLKGKNTTNLVTHLKTKHRKEHDAFILLQKLYAEGKKNKSKVNVQTKASNSSKSSYQPSLKSVSI